MQLVRKAITKLISPHQKTKLAFTGEREGRESIDSREGESNGLDTTSPGQEEMFFATPRAIPYWKRIFDVSCILVTLPCWLPLLSIVVLWIKTTSRGPVFYRQKRVGYDKRCFVIFKLRTMHVNAETETHKSYFEHLMQVEKPMTKLDASDPRLIRGGRFLRAIGLDELPQLFNVLRGEMSLVGPRPCLPHEFERYKSWQRQRVNVSPGLTGYWQVNGKNKTTFSEMIAMDLFYARNMSLWLDLTIILKTIPALITQAGELRTIADAQSRNGAVTASNGARD